ncbi:MULTISPECIES: BlaI/MecI/CopY family transcriptional regulator [Bacteria]
MPKFGNLESAIMNAVWHADRPLLVRDVLDRMGRELAYTTVQTVMEILHRKGWLTKSRDGRAFRYGAAASRDEYVSGLVGEALALSDDSTAALVGFVERMQPDEVDELRRMLGSAREQRERG